MLWIVLNHAEGYKRDNLLLSTEYGSLDNPPEIIPAYLAQSVRPITPMSESPATPRIMRLFRIAIGTAIAFLIIGTFWMIDTAVRNPDVRARKPRWFEGFFDMPFWLPLTLTFTIGLLAVISIYVRAARRLKNGEDIFNQSYRKRTWEKLQQDMDQAKRRESK